LSAAEHNDEAETRPGHVAERLALDARPDHLGDGTRNRHGGGQDDIVGRKINHQEDDGGEEVGAEAAKYVFHSRVFMVEL